MDRSLGIVVPAYDPDVERLSAYVRDLGALDPASVRIELDAADDGVRAALADCPATVNAVSHRRGKGAAITAGFEALETDVYAFADADGSTPVESLRQVIDPVARGETDLAVGSRRHPDARVEDSQSRLRSALGDGFARFAGRLLPVALYDYQCGAKAVSAAGWRRVRGDVYEAGFGWDVDFLSAAGRAGLSIREVPIRWTDRPGSTVPPFRTSLELALALVRVRRRRSLDGSEDRPLLERVSGCD